MKLFLRTAFPTTLVLALATLLTAECWASVLDNFAEPKTMGFFPWVGWWLVMMFDICFLGLSIWNLGKGEIETNLENLIWGWGLGALSIVFGVYWIFFFK